MSKFPAILFIALDTYSLVGGLQAFNRRVAENLASLAQEHRAPPPRIRCMGDATKDFPANVPADFKGFGRKRASFVLDAMREAANADVLLIGHINLAPVAWLLKRLNPHLRAFMFVHGDEVWNDGLRPKRFYEPALLRAIDRIASVSQFTARVMAKEYDVPANRFTVFPNAVDPMPRDASAPRTANTILSVTRLGVGDRLKNIDVLIRAVATLVKAGRDVRLEIVGDGVLRRELEEVAQSSGAGAHVSFLGKVDGAALAEAYQRATIFALPSSKEGFGIVYLEAWQHELPVICGRLGAPHEIISDSEDGLIADESSVEDLAAKIALLLDDSNAAAAMGRRGREKVEQFYLGKHARARLETLLMAEAS